MTNEIIKRTDETVMRPYRYKTVEFQTLQRIASDENATITDVLHSLINWSWDEKTPNEPRPKAIPQNS